MPSHFVPDSTAGGSVSIGIRSSPAARRRALVQVDAWVERPVAVRPQQRQVEGELHAAVAHELRLERDVARVAALRHPRPAGPRVHLLWHWRLLAALVAVVRRGAHERLPAGAEPHLVALPVVLVEARIAPGERERRVVPDRARRPEHRVRVGVVEPVLEERLAAAVDHARERRRRHAATRARRVERLVVGRVGAAVRAAAAEVDRQRVRARLVHDVRREPAHQLRVGAPVRARTSASLPSSQPPRAAHTIACASASRTSARRPPARTPRPHRARARRAARRPSTRPSPDPARTACGHATPGRVTAVRRL